MNIGTIVAPMHLHISMSLATICHNHLHRLPTLRMLLSIRSLPTLIIIIHKNNMTLINSCIIRTTMRSLLIVSSDVAILSIIHTWSVATCILILLTKCKDITLGFLLSSSCSSCDATWIVHYVHWSTNLVHVFIVAVPQESVIVSVKLQLFCQFLLGHVQSLVMHAALIACCS